VTENVSSIDESATDETPASGVREGSASSRSSSASHCWCGRPLPAPRPTGRPRLTCSPACKVRRDEAPRKIRRRQEWIAQWLSLIGGPDYTKVEIRRAVRELRQEIRELDSVRRGGELLKTFQTGPQGGRPSGNGAGGDTVSQREAAEQAGMSKRQEVTAVRVPADDFEQSLSTTNDDVRQTTTTERRHAPGS
jgi:hypothetical protein